MRFEVFVGFRYLRGKRKNAFISLITFFSIFGVMIGVMTLIVVLGVMTGFDKQLFKTVLGTTSHIVITRSGGITDHEKVTEDLKRIPEVLESAPFFAGQVLLKSDNAVTGAAIRGVVPEEEEKVSDFGKYLHGTLRDGGIVLGTELARQLGAFPGDTIKVISPYFVSTPMGEVPYKKNLTVTGLYTSGMYEYDSTFCFVTISQAQRLFGVERTISGIEVKIADPMKAGVVAVSITRQLDDGLWARSWMDLNRTFLAALRHEKIIMAVILILIIVVAAFNIASTLIMVVMEKTRDIGILKSIGAPRSAIRTIFMIDGLLVGTIGTFLGVVFGYLLANSLDSVVKLIGTFFGIELFPSTIYYFDKIPVDTSIFDTCWIAGSAIVLSLLASLYPAWQASKLNPVEALRYE
ncbi:MAG: lipoprotein-releasing ABC transporter permease subunit [Candidatus Abyssobacteria bacterium SURF_5]|uniref:Lipoprotein-releasing ABC transporter permease subunit n=1 Tax=Abyssobacteria bacterium (strain SURF_5) TaxID=2093360 RepID=A0A3A4NXL1_ABYX5|nr:MAG: lipoprotein-releasing ABC transporter permease subunit [Candidatus Abyssubacteria bacterium SURF_5]